MGESMGMLLSLELLSSRHIHDRRTLACFIVLSVLSQFLLHAYHCLRRVWDEVRLLLHSPVEDGEEDEWLTDLEEIPEVPPNSPVDLTPSTSNESSGGSRPKTVPYPISTFDLSQKRENQN